MDVEYLEVVDKLFSLIILNLNISFLYGIAFTTVWLDTKCILQEKQ